MTSTNINDQLTETIFAFSRIMKEGMAFNCDTAQLTVLQLQALIFIHKKKNVTMGDIAEKFKVSLPTATVVLDKLVNIGIVTRDRNETDRRIVNVLLTEKGEDLLKHAMKQRHQKINKLLSYLSLKHKKQLLNILNSLAINIKKSNEK
jgi:MarR family transcriptional regulator, organic hydroperoxide resistance regulator